MKIVIMQPYFFPYIGYFQLMNAADEFVIYDNIEFTKKGWINRNRILVNGKASYITIPLKKASDYLDVSDRYLAEDWVFEKKKLLNRLVEAYKKAPYFRFAYPVIEECILFDEENLFKFILHSLEITKVYLQISTPFWVSSTLPIDHQLRAEKKVVAICKSRGAEAYLNPIGGVQLYSKTDFKSQGLDLGFLKTTDFTYKQFDNDFVPFLSIIDMVMFNSREEIKEYLNSFLYDNVKGDNHEYG